MAVKQSDPKITEHGNGQAHHRLTPTYETLFGSTDFYSVEDWRSVFSPAAYLVALLNTQQKYIAPSSGSGSLYRRRPDLWTLPLDERHTDVMVSKLEIVNEVLQKQLKNPDLAKRSYPFNLPYNAPLDQVGASLGQAGSSLPRLRRDLAIPHVDMDQVAMAREALNLSPQQWALVSTPLDETNPVDVQKLYGYYGLPVPNSPSPGDLTSKLSRLGTFLQQTDLSRDQLQALLFQDLSDAELHPSRGKPENAGFFINRGSGDPLGLGPGSLSIKAVSDTSSGTAAITLDGEQVCGGTQHGMFVAVIDPASGALRSTRRYDLYDYAFDHNDGPDLSHVMELLVNDIEALPRGTVVVVTLGDYGTENVLFFKENVSEVMVTLGSTQIFNLKKGDSWALIGVKGGKALYETVPSQQLATASANLSYANGALTQVTFERLDRIHRFIRLAHALGWSFADLDWALRTAGLIVNADQTVDTGAPVISDAALPFLAWLRGLQRTRGLSIGQACALIGTLKNFGTKSGPAFFQQVFNGPDVKNPPKWSDDPTWTVPQPGGADPSPADRAIQNALAAALKLSQDDLLAIARLLAAKEQTTALKLDPQTLAIFYRLSLLSQLTNLSLEESLTGAVLMGDPTAGLMDYLNFNGQSLQGSQLRIVDPANPTHILVDGTVIQSKVAPNPKSQTVTITIATSDSHQLGLVAKQQNRMLVFESLAIDKEKTTITGQNVNRFCSIDLSGSGGDPLASKNGAEAMWTMQALTEFVTWQASTPFSMPQLQFILRGYSEDPTVQNEVLGADAVTNFKAGLTVAIEKTLLTPKAFFHAVKNELQEALSSVLQNETLIGNLVGDAGFKKEVIDASGGALTPGASNAQVIAYVAAQFQGALPHATSQAESMAGDLYAQFQKVGPPFIDADAIVAFSGESGNRDAVEAAIVAVFTQTMAALLGLSGSSPDHLSFRTSLFLFAEVQRRNERPQKGDDLTTGIVGTLNRYQALQQKTFTEHLAALYHLATPMAAVLQDWADLNLENMVDWQTHPKPPEPSLLGFLVGLVREAGATADPRKQAALGTTVLETLRKLQQAAMLVTGLSLSPAEARFFKHDYQPTATYPISLASVETMQQFANLVHDFQDTQNNLLGILANTTDVPDIAALATLTGWSPGWIDTLNDVLFSPAGSPRHQYTVAEIALMQRYVTTARQLGVDLTTLVQLRQTDYATATPTAVGGLADALWAGLQKRGRANSDAVVKVQNQLNEALRDRLVPLAMAQTGVSTPRALYEYLLLDVEVSGVVETSCVKEAIGAVQLYIYRCLNHLEPGVTVDPGLNELWEWMHAYRTWQANREVFFYPENYIQPELRKDKTALFTKLEQDLRQVDMTNPDNVTAAFQEYMNGFAEVAQLDIVGAAAHSSVTDGMVTKQLCLIGRTASQPEHYYYRVATFERAPNSDQYSPADWGQWQKMNVHLQPILHHSSQADNIKISGLTPIYAFGKWYLFWVEKQKSGQDSQKNSIYTYKIQYSHMDFHRRWVAAQTLEKLEDSDLGTGWSGRVFPVYFYSVKTLYVCLTDFQKNGSNKMFSISESELFSGGIASKYMWPAYPKWLDLPGELQDSTATLWCKGLYGHSWPSPTQSVSQWFSVGPTQKPTTLCGNLSVQAGVGVFIDGTLMENTSFPPYSCNHLCLVKDQAYFNGSMIGRVTPAKTKGAPIQVPGISEEFAGQVQEQVAQNGALTFDQIQAIYENGKDKVVADFGRGGFALANKQKPEIQIFGQPNWSLAAFSGSEYLFVPRPLPGHGVALQTHRLNSTAIRTLSELLHQPDGLDALLSIRAQRAAEIPLDPASIDPNSVPQGSYPSNQIDFTLDSAMSNYYWELFFHVPFLVANELHTHQHFSEARNWYQYIFNPTVPQPDWDLGDEDGNPNDRYWRFLGLRSWRNTSLETELFEGPIQELLKDSSDPTQLNQSDIDPYDPQDIAKYRPIAYQKSVVMHYVDNLLAWGDMLFRENTRETLAEAEMLYVAAYDLLGRKPQDLGPQPTHPIRDPGSDSAMQQYLEGKAVNAVFRDGVTLVVGTGIGDADRRGQGLWISKDEGSTWRQVTRVARNATQNVAKPDQALIGSIFAFDGNLYAATTAAKQPAIASKGLWCSSDGGDSWAQVTKLKNGDVLSHFVHDGTLFIGTKNNGLWSLNGGSWSQVTRVTGVTNPKQAEIDVIHRIGDVTFVGTQGEGLWVSSDDGASWGVVLEVEGHPRNAAHEPYEAQINVIYDVSNRIYVGTTTMGLWLSTDMGTSWRQVVGTENLHITAVFSSGSHDFAGTLGDGVLRSGEQGKPWQVVMQAKGTGTQKSGISSIYGIGNTVLVGTDGYRTGLWITKNAGDTWQRVSEVEDVAAPKETDIDRLYAVGSAIYAATSQGLWESDDGGQTWIALVPRQQGMQVRTFLATEHAHYFGTGTRGLWMKPAPGANQDPIHDFNYGSIAPQWWQFPIPGEDPIEAVLEVGETLFAGLGKDAHGSTGNGLWISKDLGLSWNQVTKVSGLNLPKDASIRSMYLFLNIVWVVSDMGLWFSRDFGATWSWDSKFEDKVIHSIHGSGTTLFVGTAAHGLWYMNPGEQFKQVTNVAHAGGPENAMVSRIISSGKIMCVSSTIGGWWISVDHGATWTSTSYLEQNVVTCAIVGDTVFAGTGEGNAKILKSTDGGKTWSVPFNPSSGAYKWVIEIEGFDGGILAAMEDGTALIKSVDQGETWKKVWPIGAPSTVGMVSAIFSSNNTLYLGLSRYPHGLYVSHDFGEHWEEVDNPNLGSQNIVDFHAIGSSVFAQTEAGLWVTKDNGATWQSVFPPEGRNFDISTLFVSDDSILVGTEQHGLWIQDYLDPFGIPRNQQFLAYWDTVQQRLYNLRHGLDIEGRKDVLPLFQPPIDPMALVAAGAAGEGVDQVLSAHNAVIPFYRFTVMAGQAKAVAQTVVSLGQTLLGALEKKDAEKLARLYNSNQQNILDLTQATKQDQVQAAEQNLQALQAGLQGALARQSHYQELIAKGYSAGETAQIALQGVSIALLTAGQIPKGLAIAGYLMPTIFGVADGGFKPGDAIASAGQVLEGVGNALGSASGLAGTISTFQRRGEDWQLQLSLATHDVRQISLQILAAQYQKRLAEQEVALLQKNIEQNQKVAEFYKDKFTNGQLYQWYIGKVAGLYFQAYQLAHDIAVQAENAWKFEHIGRVDNPTSAGFIKPGYWNGLHQGLLAGESLMLDLQRMEKAYNDQHERRLEISKTISLAALDPKALLDLVNGGSCVFDLAELDFDFDFPGHFSRQIKTLSISIPAVLGPYQNIHATLTQLSNRIVTADDTDGEIAVKSLWGAGSGTTEPNQALKVDVRPSQQVALTRGIDDSGLFTLNFNDERYLPFEGTGAVSSWLLEMPKPENPFDFSQITDVVIQVKYTAMAGNRAFKAFVRNNRPAFNGASLFSLAQLPGWRAFIQPKGAKPLSITVDPSRFRPNMTSCEIKGLALWLDGKPSKSLSLTLDAGQTPLDFSFSADQRLVTRTKQSLSVAKPTQWTLAVTPGSDLEQIENILLGIQFTDTSKSTT